MLAREMEKHGGSAGKDILKICGFMRGSVLVVLGRAGHATSKVHPFVMQQKKLHSQEMTIPVSNIFS
jgi:hypothetical protein